MRSRLLAALLWMPLVPAGDAAAQQPAAAYPNKQVRIVVPYPPGGPTDLIARLFAQKAGERLGQPFVVENVSGASGAVGATRVAQSAPDGYTLLMTTNDFAVSSVTSASLPYNPTTSFVPVSIVANSPQVIGAHPSLPAKTMKEMVEAVRAAPDKYSYAGLGAGYGQLSSVRLFALGLKLDKLARVPFNGAAPAIDSTLGGHTQIIYMGLPPVAPHLAAGKLKALAVTTPERTKAFPDIPTLREQGITGQECDLLIGLVAPAGTPEAVIARLNGEVRWLVDLPDVRKTLDTLSFAAVASTPAAYAAQIKADIAEWAKVMQDAGIKPN